MLHRFIPNVTPCSRTRREFLWEAGGSFAGLALIDLLSRDGFFAKAARDESGSTVKEAASELHPLAPKAPHYRTAAELDLLVVLRRESYSPNGQI